MANKVLGIEIGQNLTRVVEIDYKAKKPKLYNMFSFPTPMDMVTDGVVRADGMFKSLLNSKLKEYHISTNKVIFTLNSARIASRNVDLPLIKDKQIKDMIMMNASDYFPVDLAQYKLVHEVVERVDTPHEKKLCVSVLAVPNDLIASYRVLASVCKLNIVALDYSGNAIKQLMQREIPGEIKASIKIDETSSMLTVMEGDVVKLQRTLNYGLTEAIEEIQDSELFGEYLSYTGAIDVARRKTCLSVKTDSVIQEAVERDEMGREIDSEKFRRLKANVSVALSSLCGSIGRVLDYYQSRNSEKPIDKVYLMGLGADFSGLSKLLTNELNLKVIPFQVLDGISVGKNVSVADEKLAEYVNCVGATLNPLGIYDNSRGGFGKVAIPNRAKPVYSPEGELIADQESPVKVEDDASISYGPQLISLGLCVVIAVILVAYSIFSNLMLTSENMTLKAQVSDLSYAQSIYDVYKQTKSDYDWTMAVVKTSSNQNDGMVNFLDELEKKLPSEAKLISISATTEGVSLTISQGSKDVAADVIAQLRTFDSITVSEVSTITEEQDETGATKVQFTVDCLYVVLPETDEAVEQTQDGAAEQSSQAEQTSEGTEN